MILLNYLQGKMKKKSYFMDKKINIYFYLQ